MRASNAGARTGNCLRQSVATPYPFRSFLVGASTAPIYEQRLKRNAVHIPSYENDPATRTFEQQFPESRRTTSR